ncbi:MAG: polysaccharide deacetylase family protein [Rhodocyclaceae bacterium]
MLRPLLHALSPAGRQARLSILIFHRVLVAPDPLFPGEMHAARFDAVLHWVRRWFHVLPLREAVAHMQAGTLPARALAITFDDGYADNHDVALPILRRHAVPATFFIASDYLDGGCMWNDFIIEAVRGAVGPTLDAGAFGVHAVGTIDARRLAVDRLIAQIKYMARDEREAAVREVAARAGVRPPLDLMMRSEAVRALYRDGMEIGGHTGSHPILARLSPDEAATEIARGRTALSQIIGAPIAGFAYPNGVPDKDYTGAHTDMVRAQGFDYAVSTAWGAAHLGDDVFQLPRFTPWDETRGRFGLRLLRNLARTRRHPQRRAGDAPAWQAATL